MYESLKYGIKGLTFKYSPSEHLYIIYQEQIKDKSVFLSKKMGEGNMKFTRPTD